MDWYPVLLALAAPFGIAAGGMFLAEVAGKVPVLSITLWRSAIPLLPLAAIAVITGGWLRLEPSQLLPLVLSGLVGVVVADAAFNSSIYAIGARLGTLVFSLNAPFAAAIGLVFLGETVSAGAMFGIALVLVGIALAVLFRPRAPGQDSPPSGRRLAAGIGLGILAAGAQATSAALGRPAMADGVDPFVAMSVRLFTGAAALLCLRAALPALFAGAPIRGRDARMCTLAAVIGIGFGVTCVFAALAEGSVAMVVTLASLTPVAVLPFVWLRWRRRPGWGAWAGAAIAFAGCALIANG